MGRGKLLILKNKIKVAKTDWRRPVMFLKTVILPCF